VAATVTAAAAAIAAAAIIHTRQPHSPWVRPPLILAATATTAALITSAALLPDRVPLAAALAAAGLEATAVGVVFRRLEPLMVAPLLFCASWIIFASQALHGDPEWYAVPTSLALIAVDGLLRRHERQLDHSPAIAPVIALEYLAMSLMVVSSLVQEVVKGPGYGFVALVLGILIAVWGAATHVRRRLFFGTGVIFTAVILLIIPPLASAAPGWHGASLWITLTVLGAAAMVAAATLEQGKSRVRHIVAHLDQVLRDWE
jgi:hypothetical protein